MILSGMVHIRSDTVLRGGPVKRRCFGAARHRKKGRLTRSSNFFIPVEYFYLVSLLPFSFGKVLVRSQSNIQLGFPSYNVVAGSELANCECSSMGKVYLEMGKSACNLST